jgi:hypothetical protein
MLKHRTRLGALFILSLAGPLMIASSVHAQQCGARDIHSESNATASLRPRKNTGEPHKFWDGENMLLFTGVAAARALDFTSTRHFRGRDVNEVLLTNGIVDNKPLFAGIEAVGTAASIGVSYLLHRTGHHRAERWVSIVHIGVATFGDIRNYGLSNPQSVGTLH